MTAIELYKFVTKNNIEWHKVDDGDIIMFVNNYLIEDFHKMLSASIFDDEGIECCMKDGYFCFYMQHICEHYDIELSEVFDGDDWC